MRIKFAENHIKSLYIDILKKGFKVKYKNKAFDVYDFEHNYVWSYVGFKDVKN